MTFEFQEPSFISNVGANYSGEDDIVHITFFSSSTSMDRFDGWQLQTQILRTILTQEWCCEGLVSTSLKCISDIPSTFFDGHDCDMVRNISKMIHDSIMQPIHGVHIHHMYVSIMVCNACCYYNVVNSYFPLIGKQLPSRDFIECLATNGLYSLPAGASAIKTWKAQDNIEDDCSICLQGFSYGSDVAKLPCSHLYHWHCILGWFVQRGTCPLCRFSCSH